MPALLAFFFAAMALPATWVHYENARFGYEISFPPDFVQQGPAPTNGDGLVFVTTDGTQLLRVYGGNIIEGDFKAALGRAMDAATDAGWDLSYRRVSGTWASFSGTRDNMVLYARAISLCEGRQYASFEIKYPHADLESMHLTIEMLVASLNRTGPGIDC
jgi:hypothetical protein